MRKDNTKADFKLLAKLIREARHLKDLTQAALSEASRVSTKTIVDLESGNSPRSTRADVIIRLAVALEVEPREWLDLSGHKNISKEKIWEIRQKTSGFLFPSEIRPGAYIENLKKRLASKKPILLCVNFVTASGINSPDIQNTIIDLLENGLWLALVVPYYAVDAKQAPDKPYLVRYYRNVHDEVLTLAHELVNNLPKDKKKQVGMFIPCGIAENDANFVMPPLGQNALRSVLVKYSDKEDADANYELSSWVRFSHENQDRWYKIYPKDNAPDLGVEILRTWRDYFREIIYSLAPAEPTGWKKVSHTWQQIPLYRESK